MTTHPSSESKTPDLLQTKNAIPPNASRQPRREATLAERVGSAGGYATSVGRLYHMRIGDIASMLYQPRSLSNSISSKAQPPKFSRETAQSIAMSSEARRLLEV
jgi:hypothetical protein